MDVSHLGKRTRDRGGSARAPGACLVLISSTTTPNDTGCGSSWGIRSPLAQVAWELLLLQGTISCAVWYTRCARRRKSPATVPGQVRESSAGCERKTHMSSRLSKAMVCVIAALWALAPVAGAQTSGTETGGPSGLPGSGTGPALQGPGMGLGTPGSPTDQSGTGMTADPGSGPTGTGTSVPESPALRPGMGVDRPGTEIIEQPGGVSPGTGTTGSPTDRPGSITGQSDTGSGSSSHPPGTGSPMTGPSSTGSTGTAATGTRR